MQADEEPMESNGVRGRDEPPSHLSLGFDGGTVALEDGHLVVKRGGHGWLGKKSFPLSGACAACVHVTTGDRGGPALVIMGAEETVTLLGCREGTEEFVEAVRRCR